MSLVRILGLEDGTAARRLSASVAAAPGSIGGVMADEDPFAWQESDRYDERCATRYGIPSELRSEAFCVTSGRDAKPSIVVVGDSHANALWPGIAAWAGPDAALMIGASSCPYVADLQYWSADRPGLAQACPALMGRAFQAVDDTTPMVVLAARAAWYGTLSRYGSVELGSAPLRFADPVGGHTDALSAFEAGLARQLSSLAAPGRLIVLVLQTPELGFYPRRCVRVRPIDQLMSLRADCSVSRAAVEERQRPYRAAVARALARAQDAHVSVLDPLDVLCDRDACYALRNGVPMYRDDDHLSRAGAREVWTALATRAGLRPPD